MSHIDDFTKKYMMVSKGIYKITVLSIIVNLFFITILDGFEEDIGIESIDKESTIFTEFQGLDYEEPEEKRLENALRDIAYYLRNHKFNEWDRRYYKNMPSKNKIGFYKAFPNPSLKSVHWEVHKHCHKDFMKCVTYLHSIVNSAPFTRTDDLTTSLNKHSITINITSLRNQNNDCKKALLYTEKTGLPFGAPKEKFYWRTSASYYMCWYTMRGIPALSMLGESCDNFANCLDTSFGNRNHDPRSDDKLSFACALYSFCPDPCCPIKHVHSLTECYNSNINPCYVENVRKDRILQRICSFKRKDNQNLDEMIENRWNVSCHCQQRGFMWNSQFGMCVDINECTQKQHNCDLKTENCLNLPGTYRCVCKWGYAYDKERNKCIGQHFVMVPNTDIKDTHFDFMEIITPIFKFFAL